MAWTPAQEEKLRDLWSRGESAKAIAGKLSLPGSRVISRDMVIGKAHRMGLPARPSPIKVKPPEEVE